MEPKQIIDELQKDLKNSLEYFNEDIKKLRTGRAHPSMLDGVKINAYGVSMPLIQAGNITAPEAQLLQITPFDPGNIGAISEAIRNDQALGLNPADDGRVVRVPIPPLTTERRQQIVKQLNEKVEESLVTTRNARHEALASLKKAKADKVIGEDDYSRYEKQVENMMADVKKSIEETAKIKEQEILKV